MRRPGVLLAFLFAVLGYVGVIALDDKFRPPVAKMLAPEAAELELQGIQNCVADPSTCRHLDYELTLRDDTEDLRRRAESGEPKDVAAYGYRLLLREGFEAARPVLTEAALAGDAIAHVQLGLIETEWDENGDKALAWAHFDVALDDLTAADGDYSRAQKLRSELETSFGAEDRVRALALAKEFRDAMTEAR